MKDFIKTGSLIANLLLGILLILAFLWALKIQHELAEKWQQEQQRDIDLINYYETIITRELVTARHPGMSFPRLSLSSVYDKIVSTDFSRGEGGLVLVSDTRSCQPCLISQFKLLNHIYERLQDPEQFPLIVIAAGTSGGSLKKYQLKYDIPYTLVNDEDKVFFSQAHSSLYENVPVVFLINKNNTIIRSHIPLPNTPHYSALFFNEIQPILPLSRSLFNNHFAQLNLINAVKGEFDIMPIKHLLY